MKRTLLVGALLCCVAILAGFGQQGAEFGRLGARGKAKSGGGGATNFLLVNTGVVLLADTGVKIKVQ